jgi:hypothetical protein
MIDFCKLPSNAQQVVLELFVGHFDGFQGFRKLSYVALLYLVLQSNR